MIKSLTIDNFALIDNLTVDFEKGLSIITGETGAGKSIILGALGLILGERAGAKSLKIDERKCVIECNLDVASYNLQVFFEENDLDYDDNSIIRREIYPSGKSRAFVNDVPVKLSVLSELGENLVDIHSQHQTLKLSDADFQLDVLDSISENADLLQKYTKSYKLYKSAKKKYETLVSKQAELIRTHDYNKFLLDELVEANLVSGEKEVLENELETLTNAEDIKRSLSESSSILFDEQAGIVSTLSHLKSSLSKIQSFSDKVEVFYQRAESIAIECDDLAQEIDALAEETEYNPQQIDIVNERLNLIFSLEKKHNVADIAELLLIQEKLQTQVDSVDNLDAELEDLKIKADVELEKTSKFANKLSEKRIKNIPSLEKQIGEVLIDLGMPNADLNIDLQQTEKFEPEGIDVIKFMFSANKGGKFDEIGKVASGGELSRVMLAVKLILSAKKNLPSIIFDEIDTGVSGDIADKIGLIMERMAKKMQVISITHLPQIACMGQLHYKVFKHDNGGDTQTEMKVLSSDERVEEIAKMLSGSKITESALTHAKELLAVKNV